MSTRCQIAFYDEGKPGTKQWTALLYRHSDGYPNGDAGVMASLARFFKQSPRTDAEYCAAWFLHHMIEEHRAVMIRIRDEHNSKYIPENGKDWLGHGVCNEIHGDIEFFYAVDDTEVRVYKLGFDFHNGVDFRRKKLLFTTKISELVKEAA